MGKIRIKGYRRKGYRRDILPGPGRKMGYIKPTRVKSHLRPDLGAPGKTPKARRWFRARGTLSGWEKTQSVSERRRRAARGRSDLSSARALQQLANITTDRETRRAARADAKYFYAKHKGRL